MEQIITLVCPLQPTAEQAHHLEETLTRFAEACTDVHATLPANIRRIFSFRERDCTVSLTLLHGRERLALRAGHYQRGKLKGASPQAAQLCKHADGTYAVHIRLHILTSTPPTPDKAIGVDLGRRDIAHTGTGQSWAGNDITRIRDRASRLQTALQKKASKGTRSTRRRCRQLLARLSGRAKRFQRHTNHAISKALVADATAQQAMIVLEDLTGIRERMNTQRRPKDERRRSNSWAFYQLRQFVAYKAALSSVLLVLVSPAYSSKMCHQCRHLGSRLAKRFRCTNPACGWAGDADLNAAKNLETMGLNVTQPRGPWLHSTWSGGATGLQKAAAL